MVIHKFKAIKITSPGCVDGVISCSDYRPVHASELRLGIRDLRTSLMSTVMRIIQ